jgi:hypothetical protein
LSATNVAIECHRLGCWKAASSGLAVVTVEKVIEECGTGGGRREGYVEIDPSLMTQNIQILTVSRQELTDLRLQLAGRVSLDAGEEHLLAKVIKSKSRWRICSPDNALIRACWLLRHLDNVVSLEALLEQIGFRARTPLGLQYTAKWLSQKRTELLLEEL